MGLGLTSKTVHMDGFVLGILHPLTIDSFNERQQFLTRRALFRPLNKLHPLTLYANTNDWPVKFNDCITSTMLRHISNTREHAARNTSGAEE